MWFEDSRHNFVIFTVIVIGWSICRLQVSTIQLEERLARRAELLVIRTSAGLAIEVIQIICILL
jgi:hypothetical protein